MSKDKKDKKDKFAQPEGHPEYNNVCFVDVATGDQFLTKASMRSKDKKVIDGQEYFVVVRDVTSASHPAYTGKKRLVDSANRIKSFEQKFERRRR